MSQAHRARIVLVLRTGVVFVFVTSLVWVTASSAAAATPHQDVSSSGPLEHVYLGNELSCQVAHTGDPLLEFFPPATIPGDCGTFVVTGGELYAPSFADHGGTATGSLGTYTPFVPVSQSPIAGSGTTADPYKVVTVVDVGSTGLRIQQTDSYVVGDELYRTDVVVANTSANAISGILYRAGDCFLGGSDVGFGFTEAFGSAKAVGCSVNANNTPAGRIEEWVPLTGNNNFYHANYNEVWSWIGGKTAFPDTCECTTFEDNGAGISWNFSIAGGASTTYSHITTFSPLGKEALVTTKTADASSSAAGAQNGYTITITNPNAATVTLNTITDTLPAGFTYQSGSTTGVTTADPVVNGQLLTWNGPFTVAGGGSATLHFTVTVSSTAGEYLNEAGGTAADGYTVLATGATAKITVTSTVATLELTPESATNTVGQQHCVTAIVADGAGTPTVNTAVVFTVSGVNSATGSQTTDANGQATFCYVGANAGDDTIEAFADTDGSGAKDPGEPSDTASKKWEGPVSPGCEVEGEGRLSTNRRASFNFEVGMDPDTGLPDGKVVFRDRAAGQRFASTEILSLNISGTSATIEGTGVVNGAPVDFTLEVADLGASRLDTLRIELSDGYTAEGNARGDGVEIECEDDDDDDDDHGTDDDKKAVTRTPA